MTYFLYLCFNFCRKSDLSGEYSVLWVLEQSDMPVVNNGAPGLTPWQYGQVTLNRTESGEVRL